MSEENPILNLSLEIRMWLDSKCREPLSNSQIHELLIQQFPWINPDDISSQHISHYRNKFHPEYKNLLLEKYGKKSQKKPEEIEAEILQEVAEAEQEQAEGEEFTSKDEKRKTNLLRAYRKLLREAYGNYLKVKDTKAETSKAKWVEVIQKILENIQSLEEVEKSLLTALDEVRRSSEKETTEQKLDSIFGWFVPRLLDKCKDNKDAQDKIFMLEMYLNSVNYFLLTESNLKNVNDRILKMLYVRKQVKRDDKENGKET